MQRPPRREVHVAELSACLHHVQESYTAAKQRERLIRRRACKEEARKKKRWENMMAFGVQVVALIGGSFGWIPRLLRLFELTAECDEVEKELCQRYLALDAEALHAILQPSSQPMQRKFQRVQYFVNEFAVVEWVEAVNTQKGLAPSIAEIIKRRRLNVDEARQGIWGEFTAAPSCGRSAEYKWTKRLRQGWNLTLSKTTERELVPLAVMRQKVSFQPQPVQSFMSARIACCTCCLE